MKTSLGTFKKIASVLAAAAIGASMSGCMDNGYIMTVDGMQIRNGVYLSLQQTSFSNAQDKLDEADESDDSSDSSDSSDTSSSVDVTEKMIDGKTYSDWVKEDTIKGVKRFVGTHRKCEEVGIALTDEELSAITKSINDDWESSNYYLQILGLNSMGEYYESLGIGKDSLKEIDIVSALDDKLFMYYYGEGGAMAVPDDEIDTYIEENNAAYKLITLPYQDYNGDPVVTDEEKKEINDRAKDYADRYNDGESFVDILYAFDLKKAQDDARSEAEENYKEDNEEGLSKEEYVQKAIDEATAERGESDDNYDEVITKDSSYVTEALRDYIFSAEADGKATVFEGTTSAYVVIRKPVLDLEGWRDNNLSSVLRKMKNDDFNSFMDLACQNYDVEQNDYLVDKKYSPEKMHQ